ncbi:MAG: DUF192 domain-containing protein [Actinomycetota bacterium]
MKRATFLLVIALVIGACGGGNSDETAREPEGCPPPTAPRSGPTFGTGRALIDTGEESVLIDLEVAERDEQRFRGLMFRECLPADSGMAFIYFDETSGGFYMKNTLIPLSIAFFDEEGTILEILDMEPCEEDPCEIYDPGVAYFGALEVNQGAFERWGVEEGDRITITR